MSFELGYDKGLLSHHISGAFYYEILTNGRSERRFPHVFAEAMNEARLAHTGVPDENDFKDSLGCRHFHRRKCTALAACAAVVLGTKPSMK